MLENIPSWLDLLFLATCVTAIILFYFANGRPKGLIIVILLYTCIQTAISYTGYYAKVESIPPRLPIGMILVILFFIYTLRKSYRTQLIEQRNLKVSTFLHIIRIPVEITLFYLFIYNSIPELMTFEGRNFDIVAGITAPFIAMLYIKGMISNKLLLLWNIICLGLVTFIAINGLLSSELPFQQFAFDQPNKALVYYPYTLLPLLVVPLVMHTHIIDIMKLRSSSK